MNSENIAATPAQERIDAVEVQECLAWPSAPAAGYCDTWLMVNAGALNFKAGEKHQVAAMANIGYQLLQEIAAYRPVFTWVTSPAEIVGALIEEMAAAQSDAMELSNDEIVSVLHSLGIDTYPSKYGFPEIQVSATNIPGIRRILAACAAIATCKAGAR